jgi:hypothetical protein
MSSVWISVVVIPLMLTELSGWAAWLATRVAHGAARDRGEPGADVRYVTETTNTVAAVPAPLTRLVAAVGLLAATAARRALHVIPASAHADRDNPPDKHRP